ncbi:DUF1684 domain-containing protein [Streptomyces sp. LRE541]|uniref:DUF1684 domain-containing protein n=1 Tax=Streptomyces sp. LRE541 TaxID=2931983 RepID=UPI00200D2E83|nr:DUF1684 domain-containing protein [Streptomyces sp. LRE541]UPZ27982.1 DUF1684 domain-containing protein [Streptomyces sp. LRE541]
MSQSTTSAASVDPGEEWQAWRTERHHSLTSPTGNLALVETRWLPAGEEPDVEAARAEQPDRVTVTTLRRTDLVTGAPEHGLRLWDADSPAIRHFEGVSAFPYDPAWVLEAAYTPVPGARRVAFEHLRDNGGTRELVVPGDITLTVDGRAYTLSAFDDDGTLLLVFGDPTNGDTTYGAGRFLFVRRTEDDNRVILDFNRAFVPPCGFSDQYNCPMPPRQNRFHLAVEAGEKLPLFRDGFPAQH